MSNKKKKLFSMFFLHFPMFTVNNSRIGLHKSMTRLSSSQGINQVQGVNQSQVTSVTTVNGARHYSLAPAKVSSGGVTVTTKAAR